ncbi:MAG TPA: SRPBCC family protein [Solirubrobacteraceae bacterium]|nr:SRPBCC family protein [Solirubrobacteraceae bacterium]
MAKLSDSASTEIEAPIDAVWAIVADVARWPEWQGTLGALDILQQDAEGRASLCTAEFDAKVTKIKMKLACSYSAPARMTFERVSGDLSSLAGSWRLEDLGDGRTRASYALDVNPGRILNFLLNADRIGKLRASLVDVRPGELKARAQRA